MVYGKTMNDNTNNRALIGRTTRVYLERSRRKQETILSSGAEKKHSVEILHWTVGLRSQRTLTCLRTPVPSWVGVLFDKKVTTLLQ